MLTARNRRRLERKRFRMLHDPEGNPAGMQGGGGGAAPAAPAAPEIPASPMNAPTFSGGASQSYQTMPNQAASNGTAAPAPAPAPASIQSGTAGAGGRVNPATMPQQQAGQPQNGQADGGWQSISDVLRQRGIPGQWASDEDALNELINFRQQAQDNRFYANLGQAVAPHQAQFNAWQQQQQAEQQRQRREQEAAQDPYQKFVAQFKAPEWNQEWSRYVREDPTTGFIVPVPGANPMYAEKANEYVQYQQQAPQKMMAAIPDFVREMVETVSARKAQEIAQQSLQGYQVQQQAQQILTSHDQWLYQRDQAGNVLKDQAGRPTYSDEGIFYYQQVKSLSDAGVKDIKLQNQLALQSLQMRRYQAQMRQYQQGQQQNPGGQYQPNVGALGGLGTQNQVQQRPGGAESQAPVTELSLADLMRDGFRQDGITDATLREQLQYPSPYDPMAGSQRLGPGVR